MNPLKVSLCEIWSFISKISVRFYKIIRASTEYRPEWQLGRKIKLKEFFPYGNTENFSDGIKNPETFIVRRNMKEEY